METHTYNLFHFLCIHLRKYYSSLFATQTNAQYAIYFPVYKAGPHDEYILYLSSKPIVGIHFWTAPKNIYILLANLLSFFSCDLLQMIISAYMLSKWLVLGQKKKIDSEKFLHI